jgi:hypothetical protein
MATEPATTRRGELPPELDDPLFRQAIGQFDGALGHAGIDPFVAEVLRYPERGSRPRSLCGSTTGRSVSTRAIASSTRACSARPKGRYPLRQGGDSRRVRGARDVDDLEERAPPPPYGGAKGGVRCNPAQPLPRRARAPDAEVHRGAPADHRAAARHPRSRHGHRRTDDGLDDGHLLDAGRPRRARRSSPASRSPWAAASSGPRRPGSESSWSWRRPCAGSAGRSKARLRRPGLREGRRGRGP